MAQTEPQRQQYPPPEDPNQGGYYGHPQHSPQRPPARVERSQYPPQDHARQGQYPPHDPRASAHYPPPGQWAGQQHSAYPPPGHYPDPQHAAYPYPPRSDMSQPPQPMQPDAYRLPPPYPPPYGYPNYHQPAPPAPAPRQRTAIACKYCRKRKIRCSGYDSSPDGRCQNCVRFNQQCLFHPVSSQAAFVPASAVYGPNARGPGPGQERPGENGYARNGDQPPMLYGAHGQPLGPPGPSGQPHYNYPPPPPQGYSQAYPYPPSHYPPPGQPYEHPGQAPPPQDDRVSLKRPLPSDDPQNENSHTSQSPHPNSKPRHSTYDSRANSGSSYGYADPSNLTPTSPATSIMSHQSYPPQAYTNGNGVGPPKGNISPPAGLTPNSAQSNSFNSPHNGPVRDDGKTTPPAPGSAGSSVNGRSGMKVHEMLGGPNHHDRHSEQRGKSDNDMLSKLDGKK